MFRLGTLASFVLLFAGSLFAQDKPVIFLPLNQTLPSQVVRFKNESFVAVRATFPRLSQEDQQIHFDNAWGVGFAVDEKHVLTALHIFSEYPSIWMLKGEELKALWLEVLVFDGRGTFGAKLVYMDSETDLALLEVQPSTEPDNVFKAKPAVIVKETFTLNQNKEPVVPYEKFYLFSCSTVDSAVYFSLEVGPYRAISNVLNGTTLPSPLGFVQGGAVAGFSGGPLLSPDGKVMGLVTRSSAAYTFVVPVETINHFLEDAQKDLKDKEKKK